MSGILKYEKKKKEKRNKIPRAPDLLGHLSVIFFYYFFWLVKGLGCYHDPCDPHPPPPAIPKKKKKKKMGLKSICIWSIRLEREKSLMVMPFYIFYSFH